MYDLEYQINVYDREQFDCQKKIDIKKIGVSMGQGDIKNE